MCLACSSQLCQYPVPTIDAPPVNGQSHISLPTLHEGTCKSHAHVFNYPSSLNQCFLLPSGDFDTAASGVSWLKSLSYQLVPFLLQQTKWTTFQTTPPDLNTSSRCNSTANTTVYPQYVLAASLHMQIQYYLLQQVLQSNVNTIPSSPWLHHSTVKYSMANLWLSHCSIGHNMVHVHQQPPYIRPAIHRTYYQVPSHQWFQTTI